jgi:hypothetical protein
MSDRALPSRQPWFDAEPGLASREKQQVQSIFPELVWSDSDAGSWTGAIPSWPFERKSPGDVATLIEGNQFRIRVQYTHGFPAAPPSIIPLSSVPPSELRSFPNFPVLGDGSLCLLRDAQQWTTESNTTDLILKAAGWCLEYALLRHDKIKRMSESGIVVNDEFDDLILEALSELNP